MYKVIKVQSQTEEVIQEMILLEDQSQPLPSPLRRPIGPWFRRIVKNIGCARKLRRGSPTGSPPMLKCLRTAL